MNLKEIRRMRWKNSPLKTANLTRIHRIQCWNMRALCGEKRFFHRYSPPIFHYFLPNFGPGSKWLIKKRMSEKQATVAPKLRKCFRHMFNCRYEKFSLDSVCDNISLENCVFWKQDSASSRKFQKSFFLQISTEVK